MIPAKAKLFEVDEWLKILDFLDLIKVKVKRFEVAQAIECAVINLRDSVVAEIQLDQILAPIEAFDRHNLIPLQMNLLDIDPGFIQPLNHCDARGDFPAGEVDLIRPTNISLVVPHLNGLGTRIKLPSTGHILVEEAAINKIQFEPIHILKHGDHVHVQLLFMLKFIG